MKTQLNATDSKRTVMAVDDDEINLMILTKSAQEAGYGVKSFTSGDNALEYLLKYPENIDIVLLDKMMPGLSGMDVLRRIKLEPKLRHLPVIIQTGDVGMDQMREGLENGAYYYLTKPFHPEILAAILHAAEGECELREEMISQISEKHGRFIGMLQEGRFMLKTHEDARVLAASLSQAATYPEFAALGLMELLTNAIEHGNLDIGYEKKRKALWSQTWPQELQARQADPMLGKRSVQVHVDRTTGGLHVIITDEGKGFDWQRYVFSDEAPVALNESNGRGIAKAMIMLDDLRYAGSGNEVHCNISTRPQVQLRQPLEDIAEPQDSKHN